MNNRKVREGSNKGVDFIFPLFKELKDTSVDFNINKLCKDVLVRWKDLKGFMQ